MSTSLSSTLHYSGELALTQGDLPLAQTRLKALEQACPAGCEELLDLQRVIREYESRGAFTSSY